MVGTFDGAAAFNEDLSKWDTSKVTTMRFTFQGAAAFNADLSNWDIAALYNAYTKTDTFLNATAFDCTTNGPNNLDTDQSKCYN